MTELTAAEEVLLAAEKISKNKDEFTEWELTVETWKLNNNRWGLRGYEKEYPDHKRVMNEIMATGTQKIVGRGWLERTRPNYYRITPSGRAKASALSGGETNSEVRSLHEYEAIVKYATHSVFQNYCVDPSEPKTWLGASAFLGLTSNDPDVVDRKMKSLRGSIRSALEWLDTNKTDVLRRSSSTKPITREELMKLDKFISVLEDRFKRQFEAIRRKKEG